jgi:putative hydrolase of HD superfamily
MQTLITYVEHVNALKRLPRTGWLLNGVLPCESVADHSLGVALLALALAEAVNAEWAAEGLERALDVGQVVTIAVVHDLAESLLTDLPKRSTQLLGKAAKHSAEAKALTAILAPVHNGSDYVRLWEDYNRAASPEARLVRDADKLEMIHQALVYERAGNRTLQEFWEAGLEAGGWHYAASARLYDELRRERGAA